MLKIKKKLRVISSITAFMLLCLVIVPTSSAEENENKNMISFTPAEVVAALDKSDGDLITSNVLNEVILPSSMNISVLDDKLPAAETSNYFSVILTI